MRTEQEIFDDLSALCASPGYAHAVAYISCRDNILSYSGEMLPTDMEHFYSPEHLIRTEIATLIGLLVKNPVNLTLPEPDTVEAYVTKTQVLLDELHGVLGSALFAGFDLKAAMEGRPLASLGGAALREPIFYGGESAYSFQYRDLAPQKYARDAEWLGAKKGFSIAEAKGVVRAIVGVQERKVRETLKAMSEKNPTERSLLRGFTFNAREVADHAGLDFGLTERVLNAFALAPRERNEAFKSLSDFNVANACPLIPAGAGEFILFQYYSLVEALYEAPFYWMGADKAYAAEALRHRGAFTEEFSAQRLELVFGAENVYSNVRVFDSARREIGEVDVLVLFGDRAIVLQAKSKRLTLEARKGHDGQIRDDFKKSVQDAYDQGVTCAGALGDPTYIFRDARSQPLRIPKTLKEIYILCVVSDHYPALNYQVAEFLVAKTAGAIQPPFVLDVFALDAMTEMLSSPLQLLSYVKRRTGYTEKVFSGHELTVLSYHLKKNLWVDEKLTRVILDDDIATDLDIAMGVRRDNIPGKRTPDGILTRFPTTTVGQIVEQIEAKPDPGTIELGVALLTLSEDAVRKMSDGLERVLKLARRDGKHHDFTAGIDDGTGVSVHCNDDPLPLAGPRLEYHCRKRKYLQKAKAWFGVCLSPRDASIRFGINLEGPWKVDPEMETTIERVETSMSVSRTKVGRNDLCSCGSGKKYKKCCLGAV